MKRSWNHWTSHRGCFRCVAAAAVAIWAIQDSVARAQEYRFGVPKADMVVTVNRDASVTIAYDITFHNDQSGHPIDIVDIGTPDDRFDLAGITASIDGESLRDVRQSTYLAAGFEVHLGGQTIPPGGQGTFLVEFTMPDRVYQDTTRDDHASLRITPTWFGEAYVSGDTHLRIMVQLPESIHPQEALHQGRSFSHKAATNHGAVVGWDFPATRLTNPHPVAVSFPRRDLERVVVKTRWEMLVDWFTGDVRARVFLGLLGLGLLGLTFFRFSGGTGVSVFCFLAIGLIVLFIASPAWHLVALPLLVMLASLNEWALGRRRSSYMPPIAQVEGGGIKRGLTSPEAAALLEMPVAKVLALVVFGMLKKGIVRQTQATPLVVQLDDAFRVPDSTAFDTATQRQAFYRQAAQKRGIVVHGYEHPFLFLIGRNPGKPLEKLDFSAAMKGLLAQVAGRMKGFDLSDTQEYYRSIVRRACRQAAAIGDIAQRERAIDRDLEWILMDEHHSDVFAQEHPYHPIWIRPVAGQSLGASAAPVPSAGPTPLRDVAASFSGWAENTMSGLAGAIAPHSLTASKSGGFLDLTGFDRVTGEFLRALSESSGGNSGGGGGCACACAGCACACACAGGGR